MTRTTRTQIDNEMYNRKGIDWWNEGGGGDLTSLRYLVNPVRFAYFHKILRLREHAGHHARTVLDIGCGGGFLSEEFAKLGLEVTGIDPAAASVESARTHAEREGLRIDYRTGCGEKPPFDDGSFDVVLCCDVLEHVDSVEEVIGQVARVLKPGGVFFYDTINRTFRSKIAVIKVMQEWRWTAFAQPNSHVWDKFIKPDELTAMLSNKSLANREMRGISAGGNPVSTILALRRCANGKMTFRELGQRMPFRESDDISVSYMGYATKEVQ